MKPFRLTNEIYEQLMSDFSTKLLNGKFTGGNISYTTTLKKTVSDDPIQVLFTPKAYIKMYTLINCYDSEIGWRGIVEHPDKKIFVITDILVFPQKVSAATVDTDEKEYDEWKNALPDDIFNKIRFYGHSHVNMGTNPSNVDMRERTDLISQFGDTGYLIFGIFNKKGAWSWELYDMETGMVYDEEDLCIDVIFDDDTSIWDILEDADKKVTKVTNVSYSTKGTRLMGSEDKKLANYYENDDNYSYYSYQR